MLKSSNCVSEAGKNHITQLTQFLGSLWELSAYFAAEKEHRETTANLNKLIQVQSIIQSFPLLMDIVNTVISI